jgi:hypothetical protein
LPTGNVALVKILPKKYFILPSDMYTPKSMSPSVLKNNEIFVSQLDILFENWKKYINEGICQNVILGEIKNTTEMKIMIIISSPDDNKY